MENHRILQMMMMQAMICSRSTKEQMEISVNIIVVIGGLARCMVKAKKQYWLLMMDRSRNISNTIMELIKKELKMGKGI